MGSRSPSKTGSQTSAKEEPEVEFCCKPDFIYGGPFIKQKKIEPFIETTTPINLQLSGTFKRSFAFYSLKERLPIILTKVIDYLSRQGAKIKSSTGASDEDIRSYIQYITKLKNDLITNKKYDHLTVDTKDAKKWNEWLDNQQQPHYFTNTWVFSECYVYRRLREGCELTKGLTKFDPFDEQKEKSFADSLEAMCIVADKLVDMLPEGEKDKRKADFITLLKLSLWANKCDLSLGEQVNIAGKVESSTTSAPVMDPFQMIIDFKDKLLVDDTAKIADQVVAKAEAVAKAIEGNTTFKFKCSCHRLATLAAVAQCHEPSPSAPSSAKTTPKSSPPPTPAEAADGGDEEEEPPKIPCPAKMTIPQSVMFDIICDNAGYELFTDLCIAHFLVAQKIVEKVRFHVKNMPWFVSDVTERDFKYVIDSCIRANYSRTIDPEPKPEPAEGEEAPEPEEPRVITSDRLRDVAEQWSQYVEDGTFVLMAEDYWTWPHVYKDMKKYDYNLYRKLQYAVALLFKGDLNYRKLLGERNCSPYLGFEAALQGFIPAPIIAVRTVKADLICAMPKGKWDALNKIDDKWMQKGDYGVIHFCAKAEALKVSDKPCIDYCVACFGEGCPVHTDM